MKMPPTYRLASDEDGDEELPGFRFHPTDDELLTFYLRKRVDGKSHSFQCLISDLDIYKHDPWDLPRMAVLGEGQREWYFFVPRDKKYKNSNRPNRVTKSGFWKATGTDKPINALIGCIGLKKSLVFYLGKASRGTKTDWMMHEFRFPNPPDCNHGETCWAICRIFKRKCASKSPRGEIAETYAICDGNLDIFCPYLEAHPDPDNSLGGGESEEDTKSQNTSHTSIPRDSPPVFNPTSNDHNQPIHGSFDATTQITEMDSSIPGASTPNVDGKKLKLKLSKVSNSEVNFFADFRCPLFTPVPDARPFDNLKAPGALGDGTTIFFDPLALECASSIWSPSPITYLWDQWNP